MDQNLLREIVTLAGFICFALIFFWAWGKPAQAKFKEAAQQPIDDDDTPKPGKRLGRGLE
ncbi:cbb3-type cytochrome oxidase subunit 3 [Parachitinimonas caeni]|uniref:Cbb3-type cytochrome c oxidase subunit 3 n=1 Tax=Parachitinimonas caeni TaxID=3031301 RepID=A0ABT7DX63_9NEIS|nr:cbb3-type cytochrome c oxidase subunit 3 [Parachitinimonas caeni]MDK2124656.1 cbb3-type cytochrome c oxidase subunit 3 [Parachitinimonas caeni]